MRLSDHLPPTPIPYLSLVLSGLMEFRDYTSHQDIIVFLGSARLTDISGVSEIKAMESALPLPRAYDQRTYAFFESHSRFGMMDAAFHKEAMVNFRAQLLFTANSANRDMFEYWDTDFLPVVHGLIYASPVEESESQVVWHTRSVYRPRLGGLISVARLDKEDAFISFSVTDEEFA